MSTQNRKRLHPYSIVLHVKQIDRMQANTSIPFSIINSTDGVNQGGRGVVGDVEGCVKSDKGGGEGSVDVGWWYNSLLSLWASQNDNDNSIGNGSGKQAG